MSAETVVELCAGAGGLATGIHNAGFRHRLAVDLDGDCCKTLASNWSWDVLQSDLQTINYSVLNLQPDLLAGGPPCQPFSVAGLHAADSDPRDMFPQVVRAVREMRPKSFLFENVSGLMRARFSDYVEYISLQLQEPELPIKRHELWYEHSLRLRRASLRSNEGSRLRYTVTRQILNAADFGVPQRRLRVFFVGFREDLGARWSFPLATHSEASLLHTKWITGEYWQRHGLRPRSPTAAQARAGSNAAQQPELLLRAPWQTVRDAVGLLPDPERRPRAAARFDDHIFVPGARCYPPGHTGCLFDEPAKALKAGVNGVGGGENMLRRQDDKDDSVRYFTFLEMRRIQSFPDAYIFSGTRSATTRQLGNAVPPLLAKCIAESIRHALQRVKG